jgi:cytochrome c-type biogenesis protein
MEVSLALAFAAGLLSFASPCVLALVPVYLAFLGESAGQVTISGSGAVAVVGRGPLLGQAALFVLGFSAVFVLVGTPVGLLGTALFQVELVRQVAGAAIVLLGILTTGALGPVLDRWAVPAPGPGALPPGRVARAVALGAFVAVGWTPCIGPVLGTILTMGASSQQGPVALLLLIGYSAGLAAPFLLAAIALPKLRPLIDALRRHHTAIRRIAGLFIVAMGVLIFTNAFARMAGLFSFFL